MSWQLASWLLLAAVLMAGFVWYERSRPPSQIVALTAAMAALAVAGRLVLAPIPNVVATTDIVLFTGYAIGGAAGFATGALAGVVSNFWLGQGPWTPWQMAGWGLVGILGAALAATAGRRLGRVQLAAACGVAGLAFGVLQDFSILVTYGGEVSFDRFTALSVRGIPFNVAHALGNITLALVAGPTLVRMLFRFRQRFEYSWRGVGPPSPAPRGGVRTGAAATALCLGLLLAATAPSLAAKGSAASAGGPFAGASWLKAEQNPDGGFSATPNGSSSVPMTGWAALGLAAGGTNPQDVGAAGKSAIDYLRRNLSRGKSTGDLERTILVVASAGLNPKSFGGRNLARDLSKHRSPDGSYEGQVNLTAFGVLAMRAAKSNSGVDASVNWLRQAQNSDGGWGFTPDAASDADSTGAVLQALRKGGPATRGVSFLRSAQQANGGFPLAHGGPVNTQSTSWAVQGLVAAGVTPATVVTGGKSPLDYLASVQASNGHYRYSSSSDQTPIWVTAQALLAANQKAFPLSRVPRTVASTSTASATTGAVGGFGAVVPSASTGAAIGTPSAKAAPSPAAAGPAPSTAPVDTRPRLTTPAPASPASAETAGGLDTKQRIGVALGAALFFAGIGWLCYRRRWWPFPFSELPRVPFVPIRSASQAPATAGSNGTAAVASANGNGEAAVPAPSDGEKVPVASNGEKTPVASNGHKVSVPSNGEKTASTSNGHEVPATNGHKAVPAKPLGAKAPPSSD